MLVYWLDIIGTAVFAISGVLLAGKLRMDPFGVLVLGVVTAVGGGVVRDMMVNDIPFILHEDFYGTVSILVAAGLSILDQGAWVNVVSLHLLFAGGLAIRLLAHWQELALPKLGRQSDADA